MKDKDEIIDAIIEAHRNYWYASGEYKHALDKLSGTNNTSDETLQRLRCMKTKLEADRCQLEFELNRIVEK